MRSIGLFLLISVAAFGQRGGGAIRSGGVRPIGGGYVGGGYARTNNFGSPTGFGNVVYPGTGHAPNINHSIIYPGYGAVSGYPAYTGALVGGGRYRGGRSLAYVPYGGAYPVYLEQSAPQAVVYPPQQTAPQVIINQNFTSETARPIVQEYVQDAAGGIRVYRSPSATPAPAATPAEENPTYLVAFKDHTIYAALAYWVESDTLHYVTNQNTHNQVSLDLIDREFSERLNRERSVDFRLPPAR